MLKKRITTLCFVLLGIVALPRAGSAGLADLIWEMSGPRLIGFGVECELGVSRQPDPRCFLFGWNFSGPAVPTDRWFWLSIEGRAYFATGNTAEENGQKFKFKFKETQMIGIDPMLGFGRISSSGNTTTRVHTAMGISLNRLNGSNDAFNNYAYKLRPLAVEHWTPNWTFGAGYNLRLYPKGFDAQGLPPDAVTLSSDLEAVHGATFEVKYRF